VRAMERRRSSQHCTNGAGVEGAMLIHGAILLRRW
jgi:hypothetical protein